LEEALGSGTEKERRAYGGGEVELEFGLKPEREIVGVGIAGRLAGTVTMVGRSSSRTRFQLLTTFPNSSPFILPNNNCATRSHILSSASWVNPSKVLAEDDELVVGGVGKVGEEGGCMSK
jgi:hypothetical protein